MKSIGTSVVATLVAFLLLTSITVNASIPLIPNEKWAQGSLCTRQHGDYETDRYSQKIPYCKRNVDSTLKQKLYDLYQVPEKCRSRYTIDHIIPLSIGGDNSPENLWPEHKDVKGTRPMLEEEIFGEVRDGHMTQKEAIQIILKEKFTPKRPKNGMSDCDRF